MRRPSAPELVDVATFGPLRHALTYRVGADLGGRVAAGCRVLVPLGTRAAVGVVLGPAADADRGDRPAAAGTARRVLAPGEVRDVTDVLDVEPVFDEQMRGLLTWAASYYLAPIGEVFRAALPAVLHAPERQVLQLTEDGAAALAAHTAILRRPGEDLSPREAELLEQLASSRAGLSRRRFRGQAALVERLLRRGFVAQSARRRQLPGPRTDLLLTLCEGPGATEALQRSPQQATLLELLRRAGGRARLGALQGAPRAARALARKLADRGLIRVEVVEVPRDPFAVEPVEVDRIHRLTDEQQAALSSLLQAAGRRSYAAFLLHGVTGSGKTEVYLRLIAAVLQRGRTALVLVPEIALTPQLAARFRARFGNRVAVLHSALSDAERYDQWRLIRSGQIKIAVGARSAVFAPLDNLGAVVVDEEHDSSFKQEEGVCYHARDLALVRAKRAGALAVLGSATPSLESRHGVDAGRLELLRLSQRPTPQPLPEVRVIDLRCYATDPERVLSAPLHDAIAETLERGEQAILFLNRRGFSTFVLCRACGHAFRCVHCSVSLTHHRSVGQLICHYCGFALRPPERCPACGAGADVIGMLGVGTERVEQVLLRRFPGARVARLDRDTATGKGLRRILAGVGRREVDILVGTQMVTKGHDFPHVTLVGVICADLGLHLPDYRAGERTFQLLTQVAGRAGRGAAGGRVLIQTFNPDHPSIRHACQHDYEGFYRQELAARRELGYPPCGHLAAVRIDGRDAVAVAAEAEAVARAARAAGALEVVAERSASRPSSGGSARPAVQMLGPTEAPIQRLKDRTRWLLLLRAPVRQPLRTLLETLFGEGGSRVAGAATRTAVDVDPINLL